MERFFQLVIKIIKPSAVGHAACIRIARGWCMVTNTRLSYTAYIPELAGIDATVPAKKLLAALRGCKYEPDTIKQTDKNVIVKKGSFAARIGLLSNEDFPVFAVRGEEADLGVNAFHILKRLRPFVSTDASRPWSCAVYFDGARVWATNNVTLVTQPLSTPRPFVLPVTAFDELLRADAQVNTVAVAENGMRFDMDNGISLHTRLLDLQWPDVQSVLVPATAQPVPAGMYGGVLALVPLCEDMNVPKICLSAQGMSTEEGTTQAKFVGVPFPEATFNAKPLLDVLEIATHIDLAAYPKPCYFKGDDGIEGMTVGMR